MITIRKAVLVLVLSIFPLPTWTQTPMTDLLGSLIDRQPWDPPATLRMSPVVVLATVQSNEIVGEPRQSVWTPGVLVQPRKVKCKVEQVLRADSDAQLPDPITFVYFSLAHTRDYNPYHKFFFEAVPGRRYLFELIHHGEELRSVGDVGSYSIEVSGGYPSAVLDPTYDPTPRRWALPVFGAQIARLLLTIGPGLDESRYADQLSSYRLIAESLGTRLQTFQLLMDLLSAPPKVRAAACFELNRVFSAQSRCLEQIAQDKEQGSHERYEASARLERAKRDEQLLMQRLRDPAQLGTANLPNVDSRRQNYEDLEILTRSPTPEIRRLACIALARYFPEWPRKCRIP